MDYPFRTYQPRNINFDDCTQVDGWHVKVYTITQAASFVNQEVLAMSKSTFGECLKKHLDPTLPTHQHAFLIVHEGTDAVWVLLNWWTGGEMLRTVTYSAPIGGGELTTLDQEGSMSCVWELEVVVHERKAWIKHILSPQTPDFPSYRKDFMLR